MVNTISTPSNVQPGANPLIGHEPLIPKELSVPKRRDSVAFGQGKPLSGLEVQNVVLERAFEKLAAIVQDARAQLGIPEGATLDTSEKATAGRIVDFALGFFAKFAESHGLEDNEDGRAQFAAFIGGAISQGINEARGILTALNALDNNSFDIDKTAGIVQSRLDDFVLNGLSA